MNEAGRVIASKADRPLRHLRRCHFAERRGHPAFKDIRKIKQIFVLEGCDRCLDLSEPRRGMSGLIGTALGTYFQHTASVSMVSR